jgi:hypothetical protein
VEVGDPWRRDGFDEAQTHMLGQGLEEGSAATEQDRHLMENQLVDEACLPRGGGNAAAISCC